MKKNSLSLKQALKLNEKEYQRLFYKHINPGLFSIYKILGFTDMDIESCKGLSIKLKNGTQILDFTSGIGVLALGHNHPKILEAEALCHQLELIDVQKFGINRLQSVLAFNISTMMPDPLDTSFFTVSGAEAVEAGIKLITRIQPKFKRKFITFHEDYHGKTHGALSFTNSEKFAEGFHIGIPQENIIKINPGDIKQLKQTIIDNRIKNDNSIAAMVIEPIQGQVLGIHPKGYLKEAIELCKKNRILTLVDEIKVGLGRTGKLFSFFDQGFVPDIVTISKALGGGKRAIGAMVTSSKLSKKAYGKRKDSAMHSTTFGGLGESCAVAIETLNIISDNTFLTDIQNKGDYFCKRLNELRKKYPNIIKDILGEGLYIGIVFNFIPFENKIKKVRIPFINDIKVILMGSIVRYLYRKYGILTHFTPPRPDMLVIMPPLIIKSSEIDFFIDSLDQTLALGLGNLFKNFIVNNVRELI